jgi:Family of unknown function (DUF6627)
MEGFMLSSSYFKTISRILILAMLHLCWLTSYGYAEMIPTESSIGQSSTSNTDRQRILGLLDRQEVIDELEKYGVSKVEAAARINNLTDEEVTTLVAEIDRLPAGGQDYVKAAAGVVLIVFYIFVVLFKGMLCIFFGFTGLSDSLEEECGLSYIFHVKGMGEAFDYIEHGHLGRGPSKYDYTDLEGDAIEDCDPRMESCAYGSDEKEKEVDSVPVEEDCDPGMESCP